MFVDNFSYIVVAFCAAFVALDLVSRRRGHHVAKFAQQNRVGTRPTFQRHNQTALRMGLLDDLAKAFQNDPAFVAPADEPAAGEDLPKWEKPNPTATFTTSV